MGRWRGWENVKVGRDGRMVKDSLAYPIDTNKYHNVLCTADGMRFQSKRERDYYLRDLLPRWNAGEVKWFIRQVRFDLPGNIVYRADFLEVWADGSVHVIDVKGHKTYVYKMKKKQVEQLYPIKIEEK